MSENNLCGIDRYTGKGTYTAEGIDAISDALRVNSVLTSLDLGWNDLGGGEAALREIAKDRPSLTLKL